MATHSEQLTSNLNHILRAAGFFLVCESHECIDDSGVITELKVRVCTISDEPRDAPIDFGHVMLALANWQNGRRFCKLVIVLQSECYVRWVIMNDRMHQIFSRGMYEFSIKYTDPVNVDESVLHMLTTCLENARHSLKTLSMINCVRSDDNVVAIMKSMVVDNYVLEKLDMSSVYANEKLMLPVSSVNHSPVGKLKSAWFVSADASSAVMGLHHANVMYSKVVVNTSNNMIIPSALTVVPNKYLSAGVGVNVVSENWMNDLIYAFSSMPDPLESVVPACVYASLIPPSVLRLHHMMRWTVDDPTVINVPTNIEFSAIIIDFKKKTFGGRYNFVYKCSLLPAETSSSLVVTERPLSAYDMGLVCPDGGACSETRAKLIDNIKTQCVNANMHMTLISSVTLKKSM